MRHWNLIKNIKNWPQYYVYKFGFAHPNAISFQTRKGLTIDVPIGVLSEFKEVYFGENYITPFGMDCSGEYTVIDVGANVGFFSLFAYERFPNAKIFSFEPVPNNFKKLKRHIVKNGCDRIHCYLQAVTKENGKTSIWVDPTQDITTNASIRNTLHQGQPLEIETISLTGIFNYLKIASCDLLKLDCEGAEFEIIYETPIEVLKKVKRFAMEVHQTHILPRNNLKELRSYLDNLGFSTKTAYDENIYSMLWAWK